MSLNLVLFLSFCIYSRLDVNSGSSRFISYQRSQFLNSLSHELLSDSKYSLERSQKNIANWWRTEPSMRVGYGISAGYLLSSWPGILLHAPPSLWLYICWSCWGYTLSALSCSLLHCGPTAMGKYLLLLLVGIFLLVGFLQGEILADSVGRQTYDYYSVLWFGKMSSRRSDMTVFRHDPWTLYSFTLYSILLSSLAADMTALCLSIFFPNLGPSSVHAVNVGWKLVKKSSW